MTTTLFDLIRHGEPAGGHMYRGHKDDPLSDLGWQQMRDAIQAGDQWDHILTSPLLRCREFAAELSKQQHIPLTVAHDFKEISFGDWEGKTREQVAQEYGDHQAKFRIFTSVSATPGHCGNRRYKVRGSCWSAMAALSAWC